MIVSVRNWTSGFFRPQRISAAKVEREQRTDVKARPAKQGFLKTWEMMLARQVDLALGPFSE